ncbi:MAG: T9SS type A sorting domain-containing protein [Reichenbachiella sp.]
MKTMTIKTFALSLVVVLMSTVAFADEKSEKEVSPELDVQITKSADSKVVIKFTKLEGEVVKVKIYDAYGTLVFSDKEAEGSKYSKRFDLSAFPAGNYTYKVSNELYSVSKVVAKN